MKKKQRTKLKSRQQIKLERSKKVKHLFYAEYKSIKEIASILATSYNIVASDLRYNPYANPNHYQKNPEQIRQKLMEKYIQKLQIRYGYSLNEIAEKLNRCLSSMYRILNNAQQNQQQTNNGLNSILDKRGAIGKRISAEVRIILEVKSKQERISIPEIADRLGVSRETIYNDLKRIKAQDPEVYTQLHQHIKRVNSAS